MSEDLRALFAAALFCIPGLPASAQVPEPGDSAMATVMKLAAPGEHHRHMAQISGDWKAAAKFWMVPGEPPVESAGTLHVEAILGGRFLRSEYSGALAGLALNGFGLDGYDSVQQKHVGVWVDNMSTWILLFEGTCSDDGKVTTTTSQFTDPATRKPTTMRSVVTVVDPNRMVFEAYLKADSEPEFVKSMEITYTR